MNKLCIFVGMVIFSWIGWAIGAKIGLMTAFLLSSIGTFIGIYLGWKINRDFF
jgi:hypothetical protein